jgi:hypothetical protein
MVGIEKVDPLSSSIVSVSPRSYGIILSQPYSLHKHDQGHLAKHSVSNRSLEKGSITWLILKGELLLPSKGEKGQFSTKTSEKDFVFNFRPNESRSFNLPIYEYPDDDVPSRLETARNGIVHRFMGRKKSGC